MSIRINNKTIAGICDVSNLANINLDNLSTTGLNKIKDNTYHPPLLSCMWSDHLLNDIQWLRADTFSWQSGDVYKSVYDKLVKEQSEWWATHAETEVEVENGVPFIRTSNGFKITSPGNEQLVLNAYNNTGIAWYYILDAENKRFKLPRTKFGFEGLRTNVGDYITESLPNIRGAYRPNTNVMAFRENPVASGAFKTSVERYSGNYGAGYDPVGNCPANLELDASLSSSTYKDNAPVQERGTQMYLYFYVGNYEQTAIRQTAGLNAELFNNKVDLSSSFGFPRGDIFDIGVGASGTQYTAPANGYVQVAGSIGNGGGFSEVNCNAMDFTHHSPDPEYTRYFVPVKKGAVFAYLYSNFTTEVFRFIYAEGAN